MGTVGSFRNQLAGLLSLTTQPCMVLRSGMRESGTGTGCLQIIQVFKNDGRFKAAQSCLYAVFPFVSVTV